jgi:hypothetical protein
MSISGLGVKMAAKPPHYTLDTFYDLVTMPLCITNDTYDGMVIIDIRFMFVFDHNKLYIYDEKFNYISSTPS